MKGRGGRLVAALLMAALGGILPAEAQPWENDVRLRAGIWQPQDLPTDAGPVYGLEIRNLLWARDGLVYGVHVYDEEKHERDMLGGQPIDLIADIRLVPVLLGWFHLLPQENVTYAFGAGFGLYESTAFSGGVTASVQVSDFGDYRFLQDDTYVGAHIFFGADFFPRHRWGLGVEGRLHLVENDFSAAEIGFSGIYRF